MKDFLAVAPPETGFEIMGLLFEKKGGPTAPDNDYLRIVPIFMKLNPTGVGAQVMDTDTTYDLKPTESGIEVYWFDGAERTLPENPDAASLYKQLEHGTQLPGFVYFDATTLRISVTQCEEFILSGAFADTATLLSAYNGVYGERDALGTLKLELVNPGDQSGGPLQGHNRTAPTYLLGQTCERRWYKPKSS